MWSSMELWYHQIRYSHVPWNFGNLPFSSTSGSLGFPWNILWNFMELYRQIRCNQVPWNSMELGDCQFKWHLVSLDFPGIFYRISWNSGVTIPNITSVPWNSMELGWCHFKWHRVPWNSIELCRRQTTCHQVPWNSMELVGSHFKWHQGSMEFHGTKVPWNSMELCHRQIRCHTVPWNSVELWDYHFNRHQVPLDALWIFHGTPGLPSQMSPNLMEYHRTWWLLI